MENQIDEFRRSSKPKEPTKNDYIKTLSKATDGQKVEIPIKFLKQKSNHRDEVVNDSAIAGLTESIKKDGVLQPIVITIQSNQIVVVAGARRIFASRNAGLEKVPAIYKLEMNNYERIQASENILREDLKPLELFKAINRVRVESNFKSKELADLMGKDRKFIERSIKVHQTFTSEQKEKVKNADLSITALHKMVSSNAQNIDEEIEKAIQAKSSDKRKKERKGATGPKSNQKLNILVDSFFSIDENKSLQKKNGFKPKIKKLAGAFLEMDQEEQEATLAYLQSI